MSPECDCGEFVTRQWVLVFGIDGEAKFCPDCETQWDRYEKIQNGEYTDQG